MSQRSLAAVIAFGCALAAPAARPRRPWSRSTTCPTTSSRPRPSPSASATPSSGTTRWHPQRLLGHGGALHERRAGRGALDLQLHVHQCPARSGTTASRTARRATACSGPSWSWTADRAGARVGHERGPGRRARPLSHRPAALLVVRGGAGLAGRQPAAAARPRELDRDHRHPGGVAGDRDHRHEPEPALAEQHGQRGRRRARARHQRHLRRRGRRLQHNDVYRIRA